MIQRLFFDVVKWLYVEHAIPEQFAVKHLELANKLESPPLHKQMVEAKLSGMITSASLPIVVALNLLEKQKALQVHDIAIHHAALQYYTLSKSPDWTKIEKHTRKNIKSLHKSWNVNGKETKSCGIV